MGIKAKNTEGELKACFLRAICQKQVINLDEKRITYLGKNLLYILPTKIASYGSQVWDPWEDRYSNYAKLKHDPPASEQTLGFAIVSQSIEPPGT